MRYLLQTKKGGCSCALVALINAARYYGLKTTHIGTKRWEELVDISACRYGAAIHTDAAAKELGLRRHKIRVGFNTIRNNLPVMLDVLNPHGGTTLHAVLAIKAENNMLDLVNYHWIKGPTVETVRWPVPMMPPGNINRRAWTIKLNH